MGEPLDDKEARRLSILQDTHAIEQHARNYDPLS